jgi:zinc transporter
VLVILRGVNLNPGADAEDMVSVRVWAHGDRLISTSRRHLRSIASIKTDVDAGQGPKNAAEFLDCLTERLVDFITETLDRLEEKLEAAENSVRNADDIARSSPFSALRRQTARIRRYMAPQREALDRLSRMADGPFTTAERADFAENANRMMLILEDLELLRERSMVAQEEFLGIVAHEQNSRMLLLSIVAAIFLPLSFLTGLFGMNVAGLPGLEDEASFWVIVGMMTALSVVTLVLFHFKKWI